MRVGALVFISAGAVLLGSTVAEFWNSKDVAAWTQQDAQQIVTHSPWAKESALPISQRSRVTYVDVDPNVNPSAPPVAELGNVPRTENNVRTGGRTPSLGSAPVGSPEMQPLLRVVWASARPVRLAALLLRSQPNPPTAEQLASVDKIWPHYVIAVVGLAAPDTEAAVKGLASNASLSVRGKPPVVATDSDYRRIGDADVYFFRFPKAAMPITAEDREVHFALKVGKMDLKQTFELSTMKFKGQLAL